MNHAEPVAIDTPTHLEVSCWTRFDNDGEAYDRAADEYFRSSIDRVAYADTQLEDRTLCGTDHPLITPERWLQDFAEAGLEDEVEPLTLKQNAKRLSRLA